MLTTVGPTESSTRALSSQSAPNYSKYICNSRVSGTVVTLTYVYIFGGETVFCVFHRDIPNLWLLMTRPSKLKHNDWCIPMHQNWIEVISSRITVSVCQFDIWSTCDCTLISWHTHSCNVLYLNSCVKDHAVWKACTKRGRQFPSYICIDCKQRMHCRSQ